MLYVIYMEALGYIGIFFGGLLILLFFVAIVGVLTDW